MPSKKRKHPGGRWASSFFTTEDHGNVRILRLLPHTRPAGADLEEVRALWGFLDEQAEHPSRVLIIATAAGLPGPEVMDAFWARGVERAAPEDGEKGRTAGDVFLAQQGLVREENALHLFVERVRLIDSIVICVMSGRVDLPFLGLALACDYRLVSEETVFLNRTLEAGLPPCCVAPWFLLRFLGPAKGTELLLTSREIHARDAHALGLVSKVTPGETLEQWALELAEELSSKSAARLHAMKQSIRAADRDLDGYLAEESRVFTRCLHGSVAEERDSTRSG